MVYNNSIILFAVLRRRQLCSISQKCIQTDVHITRLDLAVSKNSGNGRFFGNKDVKVLISKIVVTHCTKH